MGEFDVITRYFSSLGSGEFVDLSVGDDAAALTVPPNSELIVSTDSSVLDTHFTDDVFPEDVGYKAVASAVSDLAAMGAEPLGMTLALTMPSVDDLWLHGLFAFGRWRHHPRPIVAYAHRNGVLSSR